MNQFYSCWCKRRLSRISCIIFYVYVYNDLSSRLVQITSWTKGLSLFSVIGTLIMFKKQINRLSKDKDAHIRICNSGFKVTCIQKQGQMIFFSNHEMRRDVARRCPPFLSKKVENSCTRTAKVNNIDVIYIRSNIANTIFTLNRPCEL